MDTQTGINAAMGLIAFLGGWVLNSLRDDVKDLKTADVGLVKAVQHIEVLVAGSYVKRDDMDKLTTALFAKLDKIESKIDMKVDKP